MQSHPIFKEVLLHSSDELAALLGARVVERATVHQWPLSSVEKMTLEDGRVFAYKSQLRPTVEGLFYERARSPLLPGHRLFEDLGACQTMALDWIDAPRLRDMAPNPTDLVKHAKRVLEEIAEIGGDLPVYLDIGTRETWSAVVESTLENLRQLVGDRRFLTVTAGEVERVRHWTGSGAVMEAVDGDPKGVIHGDFKADQVFVTADGYRVIDWQRPVIAPRHVDLVSLLVEEGIDPYLVVGAEVVKMFWFLRLHWAVEAQTNLFPRFRGPLFREWAAKEVGEIVR
jgi:hypothetical protein